MSESLLVSTLIFRNVISLLFRLKRFIKVGWIFVPSSWDLQSHWSLWMWACSSLCSWCPCRLIGWGVRGRQLKFVEVVGSIFSCLCHAIKTTYHFLSIRSTNHPHKNPPPNTTPHWTLFPTLLKQSTIFTNKTLHFPYADFQVYNPSNNTHRHINGWTTQQKEPLLCTQNICQNSEWRCGIGSILCSPTSKFICQIIMGTSCI